MVMERANDQIQLMRQRQEEEQEVKRLDSKRKTAELESAAKIIGNDAALRSSMPEATATTSVIPTVPVELAGSDKVKKLLEAAKVTGAPQTKKARRGGTEGHRARSRTPPNVGSAIPSEAGGDLEYFPDFEDGQPKNETADGNGHMTDGTE